jgi:hypothetical protein
MTWLVMRSLWTGKVRGEESGNTDPLASHRKIDWLDRCSVSCHRLRGYLLTGVSARDLSGLVTDCRSGGCAVSAPRLQERAAAPGIRPRRQFALAAGFLSPTLWFKCVVRSVWLLWFERPAPRFGNWSIARKRRTLLAFQASRVLENSMIFAGS